MSSKHWLLAVPLPILLVATIIYFCAIEQEKINAPLRVKSERLTMHCMTARYETEQVIRDVDGDQYSRELAIRAWHGLAAGSWRVLMPCLVDITFPEPACNPDELSCVRWQAWYAHSHFVYGFVEDLHP